MDRASLILGFWKKVDRRGSNECWPWVGRRHPTFGYGALTVNRRAVGAHRFSWELANGPIPAGIHICHHCDNPPCVNPGHLFAGSPRDNAKDRDGKGRHGYGELSGESHPSAKLSAEQVASIRALRGKLKQREIAAMFGVSPSNIAMIQTGRNWKSPR